MLTFRANFHRTENWAECDGIRYDGNRNRVGDFVYPLCRALVAAGHKDGIMQMFDEYGVHSLNIRSIYKAAGKMLVESQSVPLNLVKFVENKFDYAAAAARAAENPVSYTISKANYEIIMLLVNGTKWSRIHGKSQNSLLRLNLVKIEGDKAILTEKGESEKAAWELAHPLKIKKEKEPKIAKKREFTEEQRVAIGIRLRTSRGVTENANPTVFKLGNILVTIKQKEALEIIDHRRRKLNEIHGKTMNKLIAYGWVKADDDKPVLTDAGIVAARQLGVLKEAV